MLNRTKLDQWCNAALEAGWLAALVVAPLFFNVFSSRVFEPDKISLVRTHCAGHDRGLAGQGRQWRLRLAAGLCRATAARSRPPAATGAALCARIRSSSGL
jgi:hypothetical protein